MKIVFICARSYPSIGGVERHVEEISERLKAKGHEIIVLSEDEELTFGKPGFLKKFRIWYQMIRRIPLFLSADIVHVHDVFFWYLPVRFLLFFKPVYTTFHGYEGVVPPTKKAVFLRKLSALLSKKTIEVGAYIQKWYGTHPTKVIYGGSTYIISKPSQSSYSKKKLRFVLIGRLTSDIGLPQYVKFFAQLKKNKVSHTLDVYGDGPHRKSIEKYGDVHGFVDDLVQPTIDADVVCASSYLTMIDALSFGKPVLAFYDNTLKKEYLETFPLANNIVMSITVDNVYEKLVNLQKDWNAERVAEATQKTFSWDVIVNDYLDLWKK